MFKLDFGTHAPAVSEVIAEENHHVGKVKTTVAFVAIEVRGTVAVRFVGIEIACHHGLAITSHAQAGMVGGGGCRVGPGVG